MKVYFTDSQIPELRDMPPNVARTVLLLAVRLMRSEAKLLTELPILFCALGAPVGSYVGGWMVGALGLAQPLSGDHKYQLVSRDWGLAGFLEASLGGRYGFQICAATFGERLMSLLQILLSPLNPCCREYAVAF